MAHPVRIVVAEDNRDDSDLLVRQLCKANFGEHVKVIPDGGQAWDFLAGHASPVELIAIFLDLKLPTLTGLQLLDRIKSHPELRRTPVIVMTSSHSPADLQECVRLGVDDFIAKPVTVAAFTKAIADFFHPPSGWSAARSE